LWEEVSGLGGVFRGGESRAELRDDVSSRVVGLEEKAEDAEHGKAAVLDFLKLLCGVFFWGVVEVEWVPATGVSEANISEDTVAALLLDPDHTLVFNPCHTSNNLVNGKIGNLGDGFERVNIRVGISSSEVLVTGEGSEKGRPDETNNGELSNTAVGKLCLTEPLDIGHEVSLLVERVVEGGEGGGGETNGVEANISGERSIKSGGGRSIWKSTGSLDPLSTECGGGWSLGRGSEGSGRANKEREGSDLHD